VGGPTDGPRPRAAVAAVLALAPDHGYVFTVTTRTVTLNHYTQGPPEGPAVLLGGSLGTSLALWDSLAAALAPTYHVVRLDLRGHGSSPVPDGPYTMSGLADDVVAVADELEVDRFSYVGLSLGAAIGLTLGLEHADRLSSLVLCGAAPRFGDPQTWQDRAARVREEGTRWLVEGTRDRWFTPDLQREQPAVVEDVMLMLARTPRIGYAGCCDAMASYDVTDRLGEITTPTLVVSGADDPVAPPEMAHRLAEGIPGAEHVAVEHAAHLVNLAQPVAVNEAVRRYLDRTVGA
jgi:3-oxoadipate enol-lactonase